MNIKFIKTDLVLGIRSWLRSKGTVFWTILFPILLILIFGAIFSGSDEVNYDLVLQDLDSSSDSQNLIRLLSDSGFFNLKNISKNKDISSYMKDNDLSVGLQIPEDFGKKIEELIGIPKAQVNLTYYIDPTDSTTPNIVRGIISGLVNGYNDMITLSPSLVSMDEKTILGEDFDYIDFFVPGMIGFTIMTSMVYGSIERNTKLRKDGILRKMLTMPVTRYEWIFSKMLFMLFLSFISTFVILVVGILVWGLNFQINIFFFILVICTSFMFSGLGMIIGRFVKDQETADMAGGAITFPMMFLAGTFFPLDQMPEFLQTTAQVLPLYYVNEGFRNAMIYGNLEKTLFFTGVSVVFALVFFLVGVFLTKWKEE
jgi:ABC-2 type transport system permease protein